MPETLRLLRIRILPIYTNPAVAATDGTARHERTIPLGFLSCKEQPVPTDFSDPVDSSSIRLPLATAVLAALGGLTAVSASAQTPRDVQANRRSEEHTSELQSR